MRSFRLVLPTRLMGAAVGVLLLGGVAGLATVDPGAASARQRVAAGADAGEAAGDDDVEVDLDPGTTSTTSAPSTTEAPSTTTTAPTSRRSTGSGTGSGTGGGSTTPTTAPAPSAVASPRAGKYSYQVHSTSTFDGETDTDDYVEELVISDAGTVGGEIRQRHTLLDEGQAVNVDDVAWRDDGRYLTKSTTPPDPEDPASTADECDWTADLRTLAAPVVPGTAWTFDSSCAGAGPDSAFRFQGTGRVVGTERTVVGGTAVDVMRVHIDVTGTDSDMHFTFTVDELFAPAYALTVEETYHESGTDDFGEGPIQYSDTEVRRLQNLQPA